MADLIERIAFSEEITGRPKLNLHRFMGVERLYAFGEWTRAQIANEFDLQGSEATQAGQIADQIDAKGTAAEKVLYIARVESVFMCVEPQDDRLYHNVDASLNKPKIYEDLQITG